MRARPWMLVPLLAAVSCGDKDPVLARVGPHRVTVSDFKKEVDGVPFTSQTYLRSPSGRKELLELLIRRKIVLAEAEATPPDADTKALLADLDKQYREQKKRLHDQLVEEKDRLRVGRHMTSLKEGPLSVSEEEVRAFWEKEREVRASHILVSDRALAEDLRKKLAAGESFGALAKAHSEDAPSASKGGDAGYLLPGSLVPEFENALFALKKGETSDVVVSPYGYHLIRRGDDRPLSALPLDDAMKTRLRRALESRKLQSWFETVRRRYSVAIDDDALRDVVFPAPPPADGGGKSVSP